MGNLHKRYTAKVNRSRSQKMKAMWRGMTAEQREARREAMRQAYKRRVDKMSQ